MQLKSGRQLAISLPYLAPYLLRLVLREGDRGTLGGDGRVRCEVGRGRGLVVL